uniref:Uncharacterized protein n=1 Tax=Podarcis muralis TaxID=64176 RepID=A0A670K0W3_PODMU
PLGSFNSFNDIRSKLEMVLPRAATRFHQKINCVTFPHPDAMPEQQLLKPSEWSYCDYFWVSEQPPICSLLQQPGFIQYVAYC